MGYLPNAFEFNLRLKPPLAPDLASAIVWFDAYVTNVDRTPRNVNLLVWQEELWLIDHGASLYFHHSWDDYLQRSRSPFPLIKQHSLIHLARTIREADLALRPRLTPALIGQIINAIPAVWLNHDSPFSSPVEHRQAYLAYLLNRLEAASNFVEEAIHAHAELL